MMKKAGTARSAFAVRPGVRIEHLVGVIALVEGTLLAAEPEGGIALLDRGLAVAGTREAGVGIGVARGAVAVGVALVFDGEGVRRGRGQHRQAEGGGQHGQAMTRWRRRQMLHDGLMDGRSGKATRTIWLDGGECKFPPPLRARGTVPSRRTLSGVRHLARAEHMNEPMCLVHFGSSVG